MPIGIIDYGGGNLRSVTNAVKSLGIDAILVDKPEDAAKVNAIIFPGQGAFHDCATALEERGLFSTLQEWIAADKPYFGICVGYQLLFESSEESPGVAGFGSFSGEVVKFKDTSLKIPHMGWNEIRLSDESDPLWAGLPEHPHVYFVHSFYPEPEDSSIISSTAGYGIEFAASVRKGNVVATQFHPEKSQAVGLQLLKNFAASLES